MMKLSGPKDKKAAPNCAVISSLLHFEMMFSHWYTVQFLFTPYEKLHVYILDSSTSENISKWWCKLVNVLFGFFGEQQLHCVVLPQTPCSMKPCCTVCVDIQCFFRHLTVSLVFFFTLFSRSAFRVWSSRENSHSSESSWSVHSLSSCERWILTYILWQDFLTLSGII